VWRLERLLTMDVRDLPRLRRFGVWAVRLGVFLTREIIAKRVSVRAAALSYTSIGAAIPVATIAGALYSTFDPAGYARFAKWVVFHVVAPVAPESTEVAFSAFQTFTENARALGILGAALLIVTCVSAFLTIEATFNDVWEVRRARSVLAKFLSFWAVMTLGPVLLGVAFYLSGIVTGSSLWGFVGPVATFGMIALAFAAINTLIPFTDVRFEAALWGGAATAVLLVLGFQGYSYYLAHAFGAKKVYGSLFLLPISLFGIYLGWLIVVVGSLVTYTMQNLKLLHLRSLGGLRAKGRAYHTLHVMVRVIEAFNEGKRVTPGDLAKEFRVPEQGLRELIHALADKHFVTFAADGSSILPTRAPDRLTVADVLREELEGAFEAPDGTDSSKDRLGPVLRRVQRAGAESLDGLTVAELARSPQPPKPKAGAVRGGALVGAAGRLRRRRAGKSAGRRSLRAAARPQKIAKRGRRRDPSAWGTPEPAAKKRRRNVRRKARN